MNRIIAGEQIGPQIFRLRIEAPVIAKKRRAGQFVMVRSHQECERIPLTIANACAKEGWIELIFQSVGMGTLKLSELKAGDSVLDLAGPLGKPTHIEKFGTCLCIGGGVGIAPLYPIVCALKEAGNEIVTIIGARNKSLLILEEEMRLQSNDLYAATDDGSYGHHGFVSDVFKKLIADGRRFNFAIVIGPAMMMKVTAALTVAQGIKTYASLNPIMIDGTGMCGGCRVSVFGRTRFACVDGPEFDAAGIDWDLLLRRLGSYKEFEQKAKQEHLCRVEGT
jgi:NAD(P)H-flavin reductase